MPYHRALTSLCRSRVADLKRLAFALGFVGLIESPGCGEERLGFGFSDY
jgi:hypothetical protein